MKSILSTLALAVVGLLVSQCDTFEPDAGGPQLNAKIYASNRGLGIVDLTRAYPDFDGTSLEITKAPASGTVSHTGRYLVYAPKATSVNDAFTIKMKLKDQPTFINAEIIAAEDACGREPITYAKIPKNSMITIDLFDNKDFCGFEREVSAVGVCVSESSGIPNQAIDGSIGTVGGKSYALFTYSPPADVTGRYSVKYSLWTVVTGSAPHNPDRCTDPKLSDFYSSHEMVIDVTE